ncbi:PucR family transcriptional regulator [Actinophytocola glycyrrhizae]|uniref:PucR family transcriptional regulator n=1 Tax=Actinophytocola glycyrrhizae TaxID=2044873 RepID=A0ABV9RYX1_9PSEU
MDVPVRWLVDRHELGLAVLAGKEALDRRISWAHSIDLADPVPWLDGGELLLTTGLRLPRAAADRRAHVERLVTAGVAALGFGVGLSFERVPAVLVDTADRLGLPLLEVPLPTPFVAITKAVSARLAELEYEDTARAARGQLAMTRAALRGGPAAVVRELAAVTGGGAALFGPRGTEPVAAHGLRPDHDTRIAEVLAAPPADGTASVGPDGSVAGQVVRVGRRVHGRLVLVTDAATTAADRLLLGHAVSLIALDRERPRDELNRLGGTLAGLLFDGVVGAGAAGLSTSDELAVLAVRDAPPVAVFEAAERALSGFPLLATERAGCAVVVVPAGVEVRTPGHAGRSAVCAPAGLPSALRQAVTAADVARARDVPLVRFDALAGHVLSAAPATRAVLAGVAATRLRPLDGTGLSGTLLAFLEHNGHTEAASAALGVHRHTLRGRMDRIRALLGVDLDDAHVRAELLLALTSV